jgi:UDP-N-acetylglucosamine 2-epimerase
VDDDGRLASLLDALGSLAHPVVFAVHPRTRRRLAALGLRVRGNVRLVPPQPYLAMLRLVKEARAVLTDSGGLQKEAFILGTPCVTLRDTTEWPESVDSGANVLAGASGRRIRAALARFESRRPRWKAAAVYGDGRAAERIADIVAKFIAARR